MMKTIFDLFFSSALNITRRTILKIIPITIPLAVVAAFVLAILPAALPTSSTALAAAQACVPGPHSGIISSDQTWCLEHSPHRVTTDVTVAAGVTLTIEAGVTVVVDPGDHELKVLGHLESVGTPTQLITFTRNSASNNWAGLRFDGATAGGHLRHVLVEYATRSASICSGCAVGARDIEQYNLVIESSTIQNGTYGMILVDSLVIISDTLFTALTNYPLYVKGAVSDINLHGNKFTGNTANRIWIDGGAMTGHDITLRHQPVLDGYMLEDDYFVPLGITLTVEPGVTIMTEGERELTVKGRLVALGTQAQPITFTSSSAPSGWSGLRFDGRDGDGSGHLRYVTVEYGTRTSSGYYPTNLLAWSVANTPLVIENSRIQNGERGLLLIDSHVVVSDTLFTGISNASLHPIQVNNSSSLLVLHDNTFSNNANNRILLAGNAMMARDTRLPPQTGLEGYVLYDDFTVPVSITLTVDPGVAIMTTGERELKVQGHLEAIGTVENPITFTRSLATGGWSGLIFDGSAGEGTGHLNHVQVSYAKEWGGVGYNPYSILVYNVTKDIVTIENSQILNAVRGLVVVGSQVMVRNSLFSGFSEYAAVFRNSAHGTFENNFIVDNSYRGLYVGSDSQADLAHTTIARNKDIAVYAEKAAINLTNTILAENKTGVFAAPDAVVNITHTLWDRNTTNVNGIVNETGHYDGPAGFDQDGLHLTRFSMAIERGVDAGVADDFEGDLRPTPHATAPDLGADEYPFSPETDLVADKLAFEPMGVALYDYSTGKTNFGVLQRYMLRFYHGTAVPEPLHVTITDQLPLPMAYEGDIHTPAMNFNASDQTLTWQSVNPVPVKDAVEIILDTFGRPDPGEILHNRASVQAGAYHIDLQAETTVPFFPPLITSIGTGEYCYLNDVIHVNGVALSNALIRILENGQEVITTTSDAYGVFTSTYQTLETDPITVTAQTCLASNPVVCSAESDAIQLKPANSFWDPQRSITRVTRNSGEKAITSSLIFRRAGEFTTGYVGWWLSGKNFLPGTVVTTEVKIYVCEEETEPRVIVGEEVFTGEQDEDTWTFELPGKLPPLKVCDQFGFRCNSNNVLIDPDGYIFDVTKGFDPITPTLNVIQGVTVTCMVSMPAFGGWVPWPAHLFENQVNPQVTEEDGYFAFFTPPGFYYLQADAPAGYQSWRSPVIQVIDEIVHVNVPLTPWDGTAHHRIELLPAGPTHPLLMIKPGETVEWLAVWNNMAQPGELLKQLHNPSQQLLSQPGPFSSTFGFDSGMLAPGKNFRRQFDTPGTYSYQDGWGHTGTIVVSDASFIYLPLVIR